MNRDDISAIFSENKDAHPELLTYVHACAAYERWGMGVLPPLSVEPYEMELAGYKRGKFLKKNISPAKNRYKYLFDRYERMVFMTSYLKMTGVDAWMHADEVFTYDEEGAFRFKFGSVNAQEPAVLEKISRLTMVDKKITKCQSLWDNGDYREYDYQYDQDAIVAIKYREWRGIYLEGEIRVVPDGDQVSLYEIADGKTRHIFPHS